MSKACGGKGIETQQIVGDVAVNGSLGLILQGTNLSVYPGGEEVPVSTAAEGSNKLDYEKNIYICFFFYYINFKPVFNR